VGEAPAWSSKRTPPSAELRRPCDLRDLLTLTIDPDTAKDFDDAL